MRSESAAPEQGVDAMIHALINGWAKSRSGSDVTVSHETGHAHCIFKKPVGGQPRTRESFYWRSPDLMGSVLTFHGDEHHFLSVFGDKFTEDEAFLSSRYRLIVEEMMMFKALKGIEAEKNIDVKRVSTREEARWYNGQKGSSFISDEHLADPTVHDFYICQDGVLTACARAIQDGSYFIVDDVQTHPDHRRQGLARKLMKAITAEAVSVNATGLVLIASQAGIPLYLSEKFSPIAPLRVFNLSN